MIEIDPGPTQYELWGAPTHANPQVIFPQNIPPHIWTKFCNMVILIIISRYQTKVLEQEIDPGPKLSLIKTSLAQKIYKLVPDLVFKPWKIGECYRTNMHPIIPIKIQDLVICISKVPEIEIDPGPSILPLKYEQDIIHTPIVDFKIWIAYLEDIKLKFFIMLIMFINTSIKVPEVELNQGLYSEYIQVSDKSTHHFSRLIPEVLVMFRTWITYIHKVTLY